MRALDIRAGEHRTVAAGFCTLFSLVASHSILETARDALFLSRVAASKLPYVYIAIAVVSLLVTQGQARLSANRSLRSSLVVSTAGAAVATFGFWSFLPSMGERGLYALYVWSGVLTTLVLIYFWSLLGGVLTVTQAKRLYGLVGIGSVLGAVAGSGLASVLTRLTAPIDLVLVSAIGFGVAAATPLMFQREASEAPESRPAQSLAASAAYIGRNVYARQLVLLLTAAAATLTMTDYVFKAEITATVPAGQLGSYFATIYFIVNLLSLFVQVFVVGWSIKRLGIGPSICVLPFLLAMGAMGIVVGAGVYAAVAIKGIDGTLRHSVHKTATELLFVPLTEQARRSVKGFIDVVGQRGGQAIASGIILATVALGVPHRVFAGLIIALATVWVVLAVRLRAPYLALIRTHLGEMWRASEAFPDLDVASLETLIAALDSADDVETLVALNTLHREGKLRLVPGLILHHPSGQVVDRALTLFGRAGRTRIVPTIDRLLDHESPQIRSAAIVARSMLKPDEAMLRRRFEEEPAPEVRATIKMNLIALGAIGGDEAELWLEEQLSHGDDATKHVIADTIGRFDHSGHDAIAVRLSQDRSPAVRLAAIETMRHRPGSVYSQALVATLDDSRVRSAARSALLDHGEDGFAALVSALEDRVPPTRLRWQLPWALSAFDSQQALDVLLANLPKEDDGMVRFRSIRSIEGLVRRTPSLTIDRSAVEETVASTVGRAYRYIERRVALDAGASEDSSRKTAGHVTLVRMLRDKEDHAIERLFRLLGLLHRSEGFPELLQNLRTGKPAARSSSMELIVDLLKGELRDAVVGLIDDVPDLRRLEAAGSHHSPANLAYDDVLRAMLASSSEAIRAMTVYHIGELGLRQFHQELSAITLADRDDLTLALDRLGRGPQLEQDHVD